MESQLWDYVRSWILQVNFVMGSRGSWFWENICRGIIWIFDPGAGSGSNVCNEILWTLNLNHRKPVCCGILWVFNRPLHGMEIPNINMEME